MSHNTITALSKCTPVWIRNLRKNAEIIEGFLIFTSFTVTLQKRTNQNWEKNTFAFSQFPEAPFPFSNYKTPLLNTRLSDRPWNSTVTQAADLWKANQRLYRERVVIRLGRSESYLGRRLTPSYSPAAIRSQRGSWDTWPALGIGRVPRGLVLAKEAQGCLGSCQASRLLTRWACSRPVWTWTANWT